MKTVIVIVVLVGAVLVAQTFTGKQTLTGAQFAGAGALMTTLTGTSVSFNADNITGMPTNCGAGGTSPCDGYQGGQNINGKMVYVPWGVGGLATPTPHGEIAAYTGGAAGNFQTVTNWQIFSLTTNLDATAKGYVCGFIVLGNKLAFIPDAINPTGAWVLYDSSQSLTAASSYTFFLPPARGTAYLGNNYGWCGGDTDGRFLYWFPGRDPSKSPDPHHGNLVQWDSQNVNGFSLANCPGAGCAFKSFDLAANVNANAIGYQGGVYDGHRFLYLCPDHAGATSILVRYDTTASFTAAGSYQFIDMSTLGATGPPISGTGDMRNLAGYTGCAVATDTAGANEYLYLIPWTIYPQGQTSGGIQSSTLQGQFVRVLVGTISGGVFTYVDITGKDGAGHGTPNWTMFNVNSGLGLSNNRTWATNGYILPPIYPTGALVGQYELAGFQFSVYDTVHNRLWFWADTAQFLLTHQVDHKLTDPAGWGIIPVNAAHSNGASHGGIDVANGLYYATQADHSMIQYKITN